MAAPLALALTGTTMGWVTQVQSKYGVDPVKVAMMFNGSQVAPSGVDLTRYPAYDTLGYYWHHPVLSDDNRGLGGGIAWAFDDELCNKNDAYGPDKKFEDTFREDFFFASFVTCTDIRASLHRAFKTWTDVQPQIKFVDVTEECRRIYGGVYSNCSLVEVFVTHRNNKGVIPGKMSYIGGTEEEPKTVTHPRPWPNALTESAAKTYTGGLDNKGSPYPGGSFVKGVAERPDMSTLQGMSKCSVIGYLPLNPEECDGADKWSAGRHEADPNGQHPDGRPKVPMDDKAYDASEGKFSAAGYRRRRGLEEIVETTDESTDEWESYAGVAAASALQYGRYAEDLRSTNGKVQRWKGGEGRRVIETFGGLISFNVEKCWYLDTAFCGPLHQLKANMGTNGAAAMIKGIAFGIFALALLVLFMLLARVMKHQHCCDKEGKERTMKQKARGSAEEMSNFGVLPTLILATCLWVPIALQNTIVAPCWECFDFEAAAVHEIGHILGLNHPDAISPQMISAKTATAEAVYYPTGANVHSGLTAANNGMKPYDTMGFPEDICMNPWMHVVDGAYPGANDKNADTGVRQSIMYSLTEHNPKVCLTSDDIEAIYTIYPLCDGRALPTSAGLKKGEAGNEREGLECYKTQLYIGAVRVLIYIFVPILIIMVVQILILACLKSHHDDLVDELHESRTKAVNVANKHKKKSIEMEAKAVANQDALAKQIETEDERVEERAQEMAAQMIQAKLRGNMVRKASASNFGPDKAAKMAAAGKSKSSESM